MFACKMQRFIYMAKHILVLSQRGYINKLLLKMTTTTKINLECKDDKNKDLFLMYNGIINYYVENLKLFADCENDNIMNKLSVKELKRKITFYNNELVLIMNKLKKDNKKW